MRKALLIGYYWPPLGGVGAVRLVKFARFLPEFGWEPVVLTVKKGVEDIYSDTSLEKDLSKPVKTFRSCIFPTFSGMFRTGQKKNNGVSGNAGLRRKIAEFIYVPDDKIRWVAGAVHSGIRIIRQEKPEVIFTTSAPYSVHLIGMALKKITGLPWVADFRDPWTQNPFFAPSSRLRRYIEEKMEAGVMRNADRILAVTEPNLQGFMKKYPALPENKFATITNGFDPDDFSQCGSTKNKRFTVVFSGSLYKDVSAGTFYPVLRRIMNEHREMAGKIRIILVGYVSPEEKDKIRNAGMSHLIEIMGWVDHSRSIEFIKNADVNLLVLPGREKGGSGIFTGKIFEYLGAGRPVLALVPPGIAADLINSAGAGVVADPDNPEEIQKAFLKLFQQYSSDSLKVTVAPEILKKFERRNLAGQLAEIFNEASNTVH